MSPPPKVSGGRGILNRNGAGDSGWGRGHGGRDERSGRAGGGGWAGETWQWGVVWGVLVGCEDRCAKIYYNILQYTTIVTRGGRGDWG